MQSLVSDFRVRDSGRGRVRIWTRIRVELDQCMHVRSGACIGADHHVLWLDISVYEVLPRGRVRV